MEELPGGEIALVLTDIEKSTRLVTQLGDEYIAILSQHREVIARCFAKYAGKIVSWNGDASFSVFRNATEAALAAAAAQRALREHQWTPPAAVAVRMGIHVGAPLLMGSDYAGVDVHHVARLTNAAHGGQILLTHAAARALESDIPNSVQLLLLGNFRLNDIAQPGNIYQLVSDTLEREFPPIRATDQQQNHFPTPQTSIVGRSEITETITRLLDQPEISLISLTGVGGVGKTRLALHLAAQLSGHFPDGIFFIPLAAEPDHRYVLSAIAQATGSDDPAAASLDGLANALRHKQLLLILDNFEHLIDAAPEIQQLITSCPRLKVLLTSRIPLHLPGEHELDVPPLPTPDTDNLPSLETLAQIPSIQLFIQRAHAINPNFALTADNAATLAAICAHLDGLPLGIELTVPHLRTLTLEEILSRLQGRLQLLRGGVQGLPDRHQTIRECIAWSYRLLSPAEQIFSPA